MNEISSRCKEIENVPILRNKTTFSTFTIFVAVSSFSILLLFTSLSSVTQSSSNDNDFTIMPVYADLDEVHGDDDIMENRMFIPLHAGGMLQGDTQSSLQPPFQTGAATAGDAGKPDRFGMKKIYSSKLDGQKWYLGDPGLITGGVTLEKQSDGKTYIIKSTSTRLRVAPPSAGYHPDQISTYNQNQLQSKGYMQSPYDWKNLEISGTFFVSSYTDSTTNGAAHIELVGRGGTHTSSAPCEGTSYHANLYVTGRSKFEKELEHTGGYATNNPQKTGAVSPLKGNWFSFKFVVYNMPTGIKQEQWYQEYVDGRWTPWKKIFEFTDTGTWGGGSPHCGGTYSGGSSYKPIPWGGPLVFFRWDNIDKMHIKNFSIREIVACCPPGIK